MSGIDSTNIIKEMFVEEMIEKISPYLDLVRIQYMINGILKRKNPTKLDESLIRAMVELKSSSNIYLSNLNIPSLHKDLLEKTVHETMRKLHD